MTEIMKPPALTYRCAKQNRPPRCETWPRMCQARTKTRATLCHPRWHCRNPAADKLLTASCHLGRADLFRGDLCALLHQAFSLALKRDGFVNGGRLCLFSLCPGPLGLSGLPPHSWVLRGSDSTWYGCKMRGILTFTQSFFSVALTAWHLLPLVPQKSDEAATGCWATELGKAIGLS